MLSTAQKLEGQEEYQKYQYIKIISFVPPIVDRFLSKPSMFCSMRLILGAFAYLTITWACNWTWIYVNNITMRHCDRQAPDNRFGPADGFREAANGPEAFWEVWLWDSSSGGHRYGLVARSDQLHCHPSYCWHDDIDWLCIAWRGAASNSWRLSVWPHRRCVLYACRLNSSKNRYHCWLLNPCWIRSV